MLTQKFWRETMERAIKTAAQTALAMISGDTMGFFDVSWPQVGDVVLLAVVYSVLSSIASSAFNSSSSASMVDTK